MYKKTVLHHTYFGALPVRYKTQLRLLAVQHDRDVLLVGRIIWGAQTQSMSTTYASHTNSRTLTRSLVRIDALGCGELRDQRHLADAAGAQHVHVMLVHRMLGGAGV